MHPNPPGHIPGLHAPGTTLPLPHVAEAAPSSGGDPYAEINRLAQIRAERQRVHDDPAAPGRIAELARQLISSRPGDTEAIVTSVEIPGAFGRHKVGRAEVYRAWPIGPMSFWGKENSFEAEAGVNADGNIVILRPDRPTVAFSPSLRWRDPADNLDPAATDWRAHVLARLEADFLREPTPASTTRRVEPVVGRALSRQEQTRLEQLQRKALSVRMGWETNYRLFGTEARPAIQGKPTRHNRKMWKQMRDQERQFAQIVATIAELNPDSGWAGARIDENAKR